MRSARSSITGAPRAGCAWLSPRFPARFRIWRRKLGFKLFERLPRGVKLSAAGKLFLEDARRILQEVNEAAVRAGRVARGRSGTLRVGFTENASWRGVVPDSFRRFREQQPDAELQLQPAASLEQLEAIRSGRLDAGFVNFMPKSDPELDQLLVAIQHVELAAPKGHPLTKLKKLRLRDLADAPFVWFPRRENPAFYDRLMHECYRGGLKSPRIVQEGLNEATILSLVSTGLGVGWVLGTARWRCPESCCYLTRGRLEPATAAGSRVEKGQYLSFARKFYRRGTALARRASTQ